MGGRTLPVECGLLWSAQCPYPVCTCTTKCPPRYRPEAVELSGPPEGENQ